MAQNLTRTLQKIEQAGAASSLLNMRRGLEKESLRIDQDGIISQNRHPVSLGSTLTHPYITTDYSEALLEFITPVHSSVDELLDDMTRIHQFVYQNLENEKLWVNSMPCILHGDESIPIADYGTSNVGQMKTVYRVGLSHRYGKLMQTIAGIHFNFSIEDDFWRSWHSICSSTLPLRDFKSERYFGLVRNVYRYGWLIPYLFGASPAVCRTFLDGRKHNLELIGQSSYYLPYATSLRLGDLGYQSDAQSSITINLNSTDDYIESLLQATTRPYPAYEKIGVLVDNEYRQLNTSLLQIENEYYAIVRPKRTTQTGEKPTHALKENGVEYVELRGLDLNPFIPIGIDQVQVLFLDLISLYCLLSPSPPMSELERRSSRATLNRVVERGREPGLRLDDGDRKVELTTLGLQLLSDIEDLAELLERHGGLGYSKALEAQQEKFQDSSLTPSAQVLEVMRDHDNNFFNFALSQASTIEDHFNQFRLSSEHVDRMSHDALLSLERQRAIEDADTLNFATFLEQYFSQ